MTIDREDLGGGRGLGRYGEPVQDTYAQRGVQGLGTLVAVHDSSSAGEPAVWMTLEGECHLAEAARPFVGTGGIARGSLKAHLGLEEARGVRDRLDAWIAREEGREASPSPEIAPLSSAYSEAEAEVASLVEQAGRTLKAVSRVGAEVALLDPGTDERDRRKLERQRPERREMEERIARAYYDYMMDVDLEEYPWEGAASETEREAREVAAGIAARLLET